MGERGLNTAMIYDSIQRISQYEGVSDGIKRGLRYLAETDFSVLEDGRQEIKGDQIFANLQSYETRLSNDTPESHQRYIDIQYLIEGEELVGVAPIEEMRGVEESHPDRDLWLHRGPTEVLTLGRERFLALWPGDAHAPCIAVDGKPSFVRKCVVKVHI